MTIVAVLVGGERDGDRIVLSGDTPRPIRVQKYRGIARQAVICDEIQPSGPMLSESYHPLRIGLADARTVVWVHETVPPDTVLSRLIEGYRNK